MFSFLSRFDWHQLRAGAIATAWSLCLGVVLFCAPAHAMTVYEVPFLSSDDVAGVVDLSKVISRLNVSKINKALQKLATDTTEQVHLVTIPRLEYGDTAESFAKDLFERWFPTPEQQAHQVLVVLDTLTNKGAIQQGEAVLLDREIATSIATETMLAPLIKGSQYNQALRDTSDRLVAVLSGQPDPGAPQLASDLNIESTFTDAEDTDDRSATIWIVVFLVVATIIPMVTYFAYVGFPGR